MHKRTSATVAICFFKPTLRPPKNTSFFFLRTAQCSARADHVCKGFGTQGAPCGPSFSSPVHAPGWRLHRSLGVQSWRGLVLTSGSMCSRSERSPVAAELVPGLALRRCGLVLWHCHRALTWTPHVSGPLKFRLVVIRHCASSGVAAYCASLDCGCCCLLRPRAVASHLLPPLACPRGRVSLRLLLSHAGVVAHFAPAVSAHASVGLALPDVTVTLSSSFCAMFLDQTVKVPSPFRLVLIRVC